MPNVYGTSRPGMGGRPKSSEPFVRKSINIPAHLAAEFELLHFDPVYSKPRYVVWSEVIAVLIRQYIDDHKRGKVA